MLFKLPIIAFLMLMSSMSFGAQSETLLIESGSAKLFTIVYPKQNAETVILLHGGPGVPMAERNHYSK